jgi:hypothetical protein
MDFDQVADSVHGIPNMTREHAHRVYDHLRRTGASHLLELGTAYGVSAAYMAAPVEDHGGTVTTVDHVVTTEMRDPQPDAVLKRAGLSSHVNRVVQESSYTWWLGQQIEARSHSGSCQPVYRLRLHRRRPQLDHRRLQLLPGREAAQAGGLDAPRRPAVGLRRPRRIHRAGLGPDALALSEQECAQPHIQRLFDLVVTQHPSFQQLPSAGRRLGWAQEAAPEGDGAAGAAGSVGPGLPAFSMIVSRRLIRAGPRGCRRESLYVAS